MKQTIKTSTTKSQRFFRLLHAVFLLWGISTASYQTAAAESDVLFCIGTPDSSCSEFALVQEGFAAFPKQFPNGVTYHVGKSNPKTDFPFVHPAPHDQAWAKGNPTHPFTIHFDSDSNVAEPLSFVIGMIAALNNSEVHVNINGTALPVQTAQKYGNQNAVFQPQNKGEPRELRFTIPANTVKKGENTITITLDKGSWILYDYVALRKPVDLLARFRKGENAPMANVKQIVFAVRLDSQEHWYANFGYYADNEHVTPHTANDGRDGKAVNGPKVSGKLGIFDLETKTVRYIIDDETGTVRDPQVHYDGKKILFSYRPGGTKFFHLYEINTDGSGLKQITDGEFDDIEPVYTPDDKIIFVSSRAKRWVQCWLTPVAILYGCDADGSNIRCLSGNVEHDNTPWILPNGQVLYTRWEYVDRSQVHYHHLWTMNPDGTRQMVFYGNLHPGTVYIDAKPVPNSEKIVASFSPGHGRGEHAGHVGLIDPRSGPDNKQAARAVTKGSNYRDPWAFSEDAFLAATGTQMVLIDGSGQEQVLYQLPDEWKKKNLWLHEPRPVISSPRERVIGSSVEPSKSTGRLLLMDVYEGRNMSGVKRGEIKKLLILETLPKPINYTGGMEPMSYGGSFTLERVVGTVPVEPDGSAHFELPALRSFFFAALDENNLTVKRMQSFLSVMPGETTSCIGCHEERTVTMNKRMITPAAAKRSPSPITPLADYKGADAFGRVLEKPTGIPDVISYPRDIQPVWDKHCVRCHNPDQPEWRAGKSPNRVVNLSGGRGPMYSISYSNLMTGTHSALDNQRFGSGTWIADGRNRPLGNYPPRTLGTGASMLYTKYCQKEHYGVDLSEQEKTLVRLWIETGANYLGTAAGLGSGMLGGYARNSLDRRDLQWEETQQMQKVLAENCASCHTKQRQLPVSVSDEIRHTWWVYPNGPDDSRRKYSRHLFYDLTSPEQSVLLLAPLAKTAGGYEACGKAVLADKNDPNYEKILAGIVRAKQELDTIKRFDMPDFIPRPEYIREMKRFGILPPDHNPQLPVDVYDLDQRYWRSLWY